MLRPQYKHRKSHLKRNSDPHPKSRPNHQEFTAQRLQTPLHLRQRQPTGPIDAQSTFNDIDAQLRTGGFPFVNTERSLFERHFGKDFKNIRIHKGEVPNLYADALRAQAFAYKEHIWLGADASEYDRGLMAHELGHVVSNHPGIQLREATYLERRAWLGFFSHYLPRKFLNNYMDDTGNRITLTMQEMEDCNPIVDLRRSRAFNSALSILQKTGGGVRFLDITGWGGALTNGTLGNFTIHYSGLLTVNPDGTWHFFGTMWFEDFWDFNTGGANRPLGAEIKVRFANLFLPGSPFPIDSVIVPVFQRDSDGRAQWGSAAPPVHVPDRAAASGADIEVGAAGGETAGATGGPEIEAGGIGGGEFGAQSSEDIN